jgi:hypothetical protein
MDESVFSPCVGVRVRVVPGNFSGDDICFVPLSEHSDEQQR